MQVSSQGRDGTGGMTTQDNLPQSKNCTVASEETTPNNSDRHLKAHSPENHALRLSCPARAAPASVVPRVSGEGKAARA